MHSYSCMRTRVIQLPGRAKDVHANRQTRSKNRHKAAQHCTIGRAGSMVQAATHFCSSCTRSLKSAPSLRATTKSSSYNMECQSKSWCHCAARGMLSDYTWLLQPSARSPNSPGVCLAKVSNAEPITTATGASMRIRWQHQRMHTTSSQYVEMSPAQSYRSSSWPELSVTAYACPASDMQATQRQAGD